MLQVTWQAQNAIHKGTIVGYVAGFDPHDPDAQKSCRTMAIIREGGRLTQVYIDALTVVDGGKD